MRLRTTPRPPGEVPFGALLLVPMFWLPLGAWLVHNEKITIAMCGLKRAFGIPCLSCGSTRATILLFQGDIFGAISMQPMMMMLYLAVVIWGSFSLWALVKRRTLHMDMSHREDFVMKASFVAIPIINWAYLIVMGI